MGGGRGGVKHLELCLLLAVFFAGSLGIQGQAAVSPKAAKPVVVLDPGHGGPQRGVKVGGIEEASYTLALAQKVAEALKKTGLDVRLTRDSDVALSAASRTALANTLRAQALVSLHVNFSYNTQARGLRVFVPGPGPVDEASAPLWAQAARLEAVASKALGQRIAAAFGESNGKAVQSLKLALFRGLAVPAAEVELDYASNAQSLEAFADQDALAAKLAAGISAFIRSTRKAEDAHAPAQP
jgi:N-acetylmuramoyl-L-alanine amidase